MIESLPIPLPCQVMELESAIRAFCRSNACYDTAQIVVRGNSLVIVDDVTFTPQKKTANNGKDFIPCARDATANRAKRRD